MGVGQTTIMTILGYLRLIEIGDIIDVALLTYIIYKSMALLRKSSAIQVAKAIIILVATLWLSYQLNLNVLYFILGKAMELGLLAIVIVFQPEIRRFLEQIGSNDFGGFWGPKEIPISDVENSIQQTVQAFTDFSKERVGALIVFERKMPIDAVLETGTMVESTVSSELVKNIFYPNAPLHDGAMVIRNGKIVAISCVLPLSRNTNLSQELGMRHRSGIGMSEQSDAIVAIVSEETGAISVASDGRLKRHLSPDTLQRMLKNELIPGEKPLRKMPKYIFSRKGTRDE